MTLRLNEFQTTQKVFEAIPADQIQIISSDLPNTYLQTLFRFLVQYMTLDNGTPHVEFVQLWLSQILTQHGNYLKNHSSSFMPMFRGLQKSILKFQDSLQKLFVSFLLFVFQF